VLFLPPSFLFITTTGLALEKYGGKSWGNQNTGNPSHPAVSIWITSAGI
jgi:hypothetical protein